jgi:hypothetical protein
LNIEAPRYPTGAKIRRVVDAAREAGIKVGGIEISRDGMIRILSERLLPNMPANDYDDWKNAREV